LTTIRGLPKLKAEQSISFMVADRTLWLGGDPALLRGALSPEKRVLPPATRISKPSALAYFDLAAIRTTLMGSPPTAAALGKFLRVEPSEGGRKLDELLAILKLADSLVVAGGADAQGLSCAWRIATQAEKKSE
jgi:hypothetical protein